MINKSITLSIIAVALIGIILTVTTLAALNVNQTIGFNGSVATITTINIGVYQDSGCTTPVTSLTAGTLNPGQSTTSTIYIKNTGNAPVTVTMTVGNWNPSNAGSYLTLTWNRQNTVLSVGESISATLTLTAAVDTGSLTTFSCDITFTGTQ